jgi:hypothetical protein
MAEQVLVFSSISSAQPSSQPNATVLRAGSGNLDSGAEWSFCLTAARLAAGQER